MMKKHDDGYTLVLVLVVMVILCLVAVSILSVAASNWKKQQDSVARMQAKYEAQGKIEQIYASLQADIDKNSIQTKVETLDVMKYSFSEAVLNEINEREIVERTAFFLPEGDEVNAVYISVQAYGEENGTQVCISCEWMLKSEKAFEAGGTVYTIINPVLSYSSYEINVIEGGDGQ